MVTRISIHGVPKQIGDLCERNVPDKGEMSLPCDCGPSRVRGVSQHSTVAFVVNVGKEGSSVGTLT